MKIMLLNFASSVVNNHGGAERVLCNMANQFLRMGHEVYILCYDKNIGQPAFALDKGVEFINLNNTGVSIKAPWHKKILRDIIRIFRRPNYGIYINNPVEMYEYGIISKELQTYVEVIMPNVIITYDLRSLCARYMLKNIAAKTIAMCHIDAQELCDKLWKYPKQCLEKAEVVQVLLPCFEEILVKNLKVKKVAVIPNVVKHVEQNMVRKDLETEKEYKIVSMGGLNPNKQQHIIIEAFARLSDINSKWSVYLYGDNSNKRYVNKLESIIKENKLQDRVFLCGVAHDSDSVLSKADIFAFPSQSEGFGLALTEAMSYGVPTVVVDKCLATSYIVRESSGGIVCQNNADSLAHCLRSLMSDKDLRLNLGQNACKAMEQYSADKVWGAWQKIIDSGEMCKEYGAME